MHDGSQDQLDVGWTSSSPASSFLLEALRRELLILIAAPILTGLLGLFIVARIEPLYSATAEIRVRVSPDEISPETSFIQTHIELITSENVTAEVIERVGLRGADQPTPGRMRQVVSEVRTLMDLTAIDGSVEFDPDTALLRTVASGVSVVRNGETPILGIRYLSPSAELSAEIANAYAEVYASQSLIVAEEQFARSEKLLTERAANAKQLAYEANQTARGLLAENGAVLVGSSDLNERVADFREQLSALNTEEAVIEARLRRIPTLANGETINELVLLSDGTARLSADLLETTDVLRRLERQPGMSQSTRTRLEETIASLRSQLVQAISLVREDLHAEKSSLAARREGILADRENVMSYALSDAWTELVRAEQMTQTYEQIHRSYLLELEDLMMQGQVEPVRIVSKARPALAPSFPNYTVIIAFMIAFGIALGVAFALLREWLRSQR